MYDDEVFATKRLPIFSFFVVSLFRIIYLNYLLIHYLNDINMVNLNEVMLMTFGFLFNTLYTTNDIKAILIDLCGANKYNPTPYVMTYFKF